MFPCPTLVFLDFEKGAMAELSFIDLNALFLTFRGFAACAT